MIKIHVQKGNAVDNIHIFKNRNALLFLFPFPYLSPCHSVVHILNPKPIRLRLYEVGVPVGEWGESHGSPCGMVDKQQRRGSLQGVDSAQNARAPAVRGEPLWEGERQPRAGCHSPVKVRRAFTQVRVWWLLGKTVAYRGLIK